MCTADYLHDDKALLAHFGILEGNLVEDHLKCLDFWIFYAFR